LVAAHHGGKSTHELLRLMQYKLLIIVKVDYVPFGAAAVDAADRY